MSPADLEAAIVEPAERVGGGVEPALVAELVTRSPTSRPRFRRCSSPCSSWRNGAPTGADARRVPGARRGRRGDRRAGRGAVPLPRRRRARRGAADVRAARRRRRRGGADATSRHPHRAVGRRRRLDAVDRPVGTGAAADPRSPSPDPGADRRARPRGDAARVAAPAALDRRGPRGHRRARPPARGGGELGRARPRRRDAVPRSSSPGRPRPHRAAAPTTSAAGARVPRRQPRRPRPRGAGGGRAHRTARRGPTDGCASSSPPSASPSSSRWSVASSPSTSDARPNRSAEWRPPASSPRRPRRASPRTRNAACCWPSPRSTRPGRATGRCCPRPTRRCTAP